MNLKDQNILFFTRTMGQGGTENVVLQLCEIMKPLVNSVSVCSMGGVNEKRLQELGIAHVTVPDITSHSPADIQKTVQTLKGFIKKEQITVIHTHHRMAAFYTALLGLQKQCTVINTSHNTFTDKRFLTRLAFRNAHLIACGRMVKQNLVDFFGIDDQRVTVIHNAVPAFDANSVEDPLLAKLHKEGYFLIGNVGRLSEQKGMKYFIQSAPAILKKHPNTKFLLIGEGEDETELRALSKQLSVSDDVLFLGYRADIRNVMSQLDLIVLSSLWEGLPLTLIEAFSVGKTVVATAVDGSPEVVKDNVNGLLINKESPSDIESAVNRLIEDENYKKRLERAALDTYARDFSYEQFAKEILDYYERI